MKNLGLEVKILIVLVLLALGLGGVFLYQGRTQRQVSVQPQPATAPQGPKKGEIGYEEPKTTVAIGTKEVSKGTFEKVEAGNIYFVSEGVTIQLPLTVGEVVLSCTNQDLAGATELDYDQVTSVHIMNPETIGGRIPAQEPVVVFAADVSGVLRAHTVAIAASSCNQ